MLHVCGASKTYDDPSGSVTPLRDVDLHIEHGQFVLIVGRSGAGKTTLLSIMGGLLRPSRGRVLLDGQSVWDLGEKDLALLRSRQIGFVFQSALVLRSLTAMENVMLPSTLLHGGATRTRARQRALDLLKRVGLGDKARAYPDQLSGGEKRRVAIASALMNAPSLLLADEPTGDLDSQTEERILELLCEMNAEGVTVALITHSEALACYADRVLRLEEGHIQEQPLHRQGRPAEGWRHPVT